MSITVASAPYIKGAPGLATWGSTGTLKDSAFPCTMVPAKEAGAHPPACGAGKLIRGIPCSTVKSRREKR